MPMTPPASVPRIQEHAHLMEEASRVGGVHGRPILLQVAAATGDEGPALTREVEVLSEEYSFEWRYCDALEPGDILEAFGITQLPAVVYIFSNEFCGIKQLVQKADAAQLLAVVDANCARKGPAGGV